MQIIGTLVLVLFLTIISGHLSARLGLPTVVGQLLLGVVIGPAGLHWLTNSMSLQTGANLGLILLMFLAGINSDLKLLRRFWRPGLVVALLGVLVPLLVLSALGWSFNFKWQECLYLGVIFAATSVSISVDVLQELDQLNSAEGTTILAAAVVDDILAMIALSLLTATTTSHQVNLLLILLLQAGYFGLLWLLRPVIKRLMVLNSRILVTANVSLVAFVVLLALAYLAEKAHLSSAIGAFFAGLLLGQTASRTKLQKDFQILGYTIFIPLFFVQIGVQMQLTGLKQRLWLFVALTLAAIITKLLGAALGARLVHFDRRSALIIGSGIVSRGEMALVVAQIGHAQHLLSVADYSTVIAVIIATTIVAPLLLKGAIKFSQDNQ
ncbi:cation:proton antiporter [Lactobacillus sp. XV13L]|nr:cation:proton antiporter [Lactobacillus sp. XV13L]